MSQDSEIYTTESLDALPRKGDVIAIAEKLGLDTEGTRTEVTARIVAAMAAAPADAPAPAGDESAPSDEAPEGDVIEEAPPVATGDVPEPPKPGALSDTAKLALEQVVASFLGSEQAPDELPAVYAAIEEGKQPCIVEGTGNVRFAVQIFDEPFYCDDVTRDIAPGRDGVAVNLARTLDSKNLFPRG